MLLSGELLRAGETPGPAVPGRLRVSDSRHRPDTDEKVLGTGKFADDIRLPGMVFAKALRSPTPRGLVKSLGLDAAKAHPDCLAILTSEDVPENKIGHITQDWDVLIPVGSHTRYVGDALALVASRTEESLDEILGRSHAHEIAWPVRRQARRRVREDARHVLLGLADGKAPDGVTVEADRLQGLGRAAAQVGVHANLDDAGSNSLTLSAWHHVKISITSTGYVFAVNGVTKTNIASADLSNWGGAGTSSLSVGDFDGWVDELVVKKGY